MGYDTSTLRIPLRVSRHNDERDTRDDEAVENLRMEIDALIASTPEYQRVALLGVE